MSGLTDPAAGAASITPDDNADLSEVTRGIWVGVQGDLKVDMADGDTVTFVAMAAGIVHPIQVRKVYSTGTSATSIVGIY
ncbi:MAG: spike base protein, RCAP_Rcc01079 family [Candidatus Thorarchaeota archaeon]|jgi:hypothetical protein